MKKVISLLLCVVMLLGIVPIAANATEEVEFVRVEMQVPYAGEEIHYNVSVYPSDECELDTYYSSEGVVNGVKWMDEDFMNVPLGTELEAGKRYTIRVYVRAKRGYIFSETYSTTTHFDDFETNHRGILREDDGIYYVEYNFTCTERPQMQLIDRIDFTGAAPVAGGVPNYNVSLANAMQCDIDTSYNTYGFNNGVRWQNMNSLEFMNPTDKFVSGVPYRMSIMMIAEQGYAMGFDASGKATATLTFNGNINGSCDGENAWAKAFMVSFDFGARQDEEKVIESVALTGPVAKAGQKPSYNVTVPADAPYYVNQAINDDGYYVNGVAWFRVEDLSFVMPNETFKAGYTYRVLVHLNSAPGYVFPANYIDEDYYDTDLIPTYNGSNGWFGGINPYAAHFGWQTTLTGNIADAKATGFKSSLPYTGKAVKQNMKLTFNGLGIFEGEDYTATYKNNIKMGTASVTIKGIGRYTGSVTLKFKIEPAKPKVTVSKVTADSVTIKWAKVTGAKYYNVYEYDAKTKKYTGILYKTTGTSVTHKKRAGGTAYYYLVRAYGIDSSGKIVASPYTVKDCVKAITLCKAPSVSGKLYRIGKTGNKGIYLDWVTCKGAKYYRVYRYNTKTKKYTTLLTTTATDAKLGQYKKGTYYFLVRAFNANGAGSAYSTKNLVKVVVK